MKNTFFFVITAFILIGLSITACKKKDSDVDDMNDKDTTGTKFVSLYDLIVKADTLDYIVEALEDKGLTETLKQEQGTYTLFLPTEQAFSEYLTQNNLNDISQIESSLFLYHLIEGTKLSSSQISNGYETTMADCNSKGLSIYFSLSDTIAINGISTVIDKDFEADNGIIHLIDKVLDLPTVGTFVKADARLKLFYDGMVYGDQWDGPQYFSAINNNNEMVTVFAPNNAGVNNFFDYEDLQSNTWESYSLNDGNMNVLHNHISDSVVVASQLNSETELLTWNDPYYLVFRGADPITISGIYYEYKYTEADIVEADIIACNGVLFVINEMIYEYVDYDYNLGK